MGKARVIYWFRTDLRLHDNPALKAALDLDPAVLWPIFTWDPHYVYRAKGGVNRWQYLLDCQNDLSASIAKVNPKSKLFVLREAPQTLLPKLFGAWRVTHLVFERDTDAYARDRDAAVVRLAEQAGVEVVTRYGRTLWDSDAVVAQNAGKPTMSIAQLQAAGRKVGPIPRPIPAPARLPDPGEMPVDFDGPEEVVPPSSAKPDLNAPLRDGQDEGYRGGVAGPRGDFAVETLAELGFAAATTPHRGGETRALAALDRVISNTHYTATFRKPQTSPAAFEPASTTLLSPFLHFGALSVRLFYWRVQDVVDGYKGKGKDGASGPPESLTGQLLFRDMYFAAQAAVGPAFTQTLRNPHCRFIPWHLPTKVDKNDGGKTVISGEYDIDAPLAATWLRRWTLGLTGFPWIDALMRQLRHDGWVHHLGRHALACFLTRGGCYVHWERGADVFAEFLLDHEPACNAGNWQWLSCAAFYAQYYRCYSPVAFGQKWDKHGVLIRRWVPELKDLDDRFIYEPWKASAAALAKAGVRLVPWEDDLGENSTEKKEKKKTKEEFEGNGEEGKEGGEGIYPEPMFDFAERRAVCIAKMKEAYRVGLKGDDERVVQGTWRELFEGDVDGGTTKGKQKQGDGGKEEEEEEEEGEDDEGEHADDAEHPSHKRKAKDKAKARGQDAAVKQEGPMDRHVVKKQKK